ncbi:MAG: hypothetical protein HYX51_08970 [Chloroflexi bacterium]|nr:hypothetical protein [Chloroflexota bacterium]
MPALHDCIGYQGGRIPAHIKRVRHASASLRIARILPSAAGANISDAVAESTAGI